MPKKTYPEYRVVQSFELQFKDEWGCWRRESIHATEEEAYKSIKKAKRSYTIQKKIESDPNSYRGYEPGREYDPHLRWLHNR